MAHQLSNQFPSVVIFLNCYPGRCGGWELIDGADMLKQLSKEGLGKCPDACEAQHCEDLHSLGKRVRLKVC